MLHYRQNNPNIPNNQNWNSNNQAKLVDNLQVVDSLGLSDDDTLQMAAEVEKFRHHAQQLVDNISINARRIYSQYDTSQYSELSVQSSKICNKLMKDLSNECLRRKSQDATNLISLHVSSIAKSQILFGEPLPNNCVAVTFIPKYNPFRFLCWIPQGVTAIASRLGKLTNIWGSGLHLLPPLTKIEYLVTNSHIPFDYPVKSCPTRDCVMVKIDVLIVFYVVDPMKFILNLGPYKLNDVLAAFLEESIRSLARTVYYDEVHDLRGESMEPMQKQLQEKLNPFGIDVDDITITNIHIPKELQLSMEAETSYISKQRCKEKNHEYDISCLVNREKRHFAQLDHENERKALDEEAKRFRLLLSKESDEISALTKKLLAEILSEQESDVLKIRLDSELTEAKLQGETMKAVTQIRSNAKKRAALVEENSLSMVKIKKSQTEVDVATYRAEALTTTSKAEGLASKDLRHLRLLNIRLKQLEVLQALTDNEDIIISGSSDYSPLAQISNLKPSANTIIQARTISEK